MNGRGDPRLCGRTKRGTDGRTQPSNRVSRIHIHIHTQLAMNTVKHGNAGPENYLWPGPKTIKDANGIVQLAVRWSFVVRYPQGPRPSGRHDCVAQIAFG